MTKSYKEIKKEKEGTDVQVEACWSGYKQVGMKKKGNRQVPNCVPESVVNALFGKDYIYEVQTENVSDMYLQRIYRSGPSIRRQGNRFHARYLCSSAVCSSVDSSVDSSTFIRDLEK